MKLQSTKTVRFETKELQRLAKLSRPKRPTNWLLTSVAFGFGVGLILVALLRGCLGR